MLDLVGLKSAEMRGAMLEQVAWAFALISKLHKHINQTLFTIFTPSEVVQHESEPGGSMLGPQGLISISVY